MKKIILSLLIAIPSILQAQSGASLFDFSTIQKPGGAPTIPGQYRSITIPHTQVAAVLDSFPVLIDTVLADLALSTRGGFVQDSSGYDIGFFSDSAGTQPLNWDMEQYIGTTGSVVCWVRMHLSNVTDNVIYIKYGLPSIHSYQGQATKVWDSHYLWVWHFSDIFTGAGQTLHDATSNGFNPTTSGTWASSQTATGMIGPALSVLNANGDFLTFPSFYTLPATYTLDAWYKTSTLSNSTFPLGTNNISATANSINFFAANIHLFHNTGVDIVATNSTMTSNTWVHSAFTVASGGNAVAYFNGGTDKTVSNPNLTEAFQYIGFVAFASSTSFFVDEMRASNVDRGSTWIFTENYNRRNFSTFCVIGARQ